eukprot:scaffold253977_cov27-Tisochrysis_lutea.AAC.4
MPCMTRLPPPTRVARAGADGEAAHLPVYIARTRAECYPPSTPSCSSSPSSLPNAAVRRTPAFPSLSQPMLCSSLFALWPMRVCPGAVRWLAFCR